MGKPNALFSSEQGNLIRSYHLLNQARSDLAKQELHVDNDKRKSKDWRYRTHNTDLLSLDVSKFEYKKNCL